MRESNRATRNSWRKGKTLYDNQPGADNDFTRDWTATEGTRFPLGTSWVEEDSAWNFSLYSQDAESVTLLLYAETDLVNPVFTYRFDYLRNKSGRIWHCRVAQATSPRRALLRLLGGRPRAAGRSSRGTALTRTRSCSTPTRRRSSSPGVRPGGGCAPRVQCREGTPGPARRPGEPFDWGDDRRPRHQSDTVIYELHVRGFTNNPNSGVSPDRRGTYAGVVEKIPYLKDLGVTAVELMPVFQFDPQEGSCWGYMPLNFFAPHHGYSSRPGRTSTTSSAPWSRRCTPRTSRSSSTWSTTTRPRATSAGRSTASRGSTTAPTTSMSGQPRDALRDFSGTGNSLRCSEPAVRRLIGGQRALLVRGDARRRVPVRPGLRPDAQR